MWAALRVHLAKPVEVDGRVGVPASASKSEASESTVVFPVPMDPKMMRSGTAAGVITGPALPGT